MTHAEAAVHKAVTRAKIVAPTKPKADKPKAPTFKTRPLAVKGAKVALGADAIEGCDFSIQRAGANWTFKEGVEASEAPTAPPPVPAPAAPPAPPPPPVEAPPESPAIHKAPVGKKAEVLAAAQRGELPSAPDFTAETHKRFRPRLDELKALVAGGDVAGLKAFPIKPISTSPKALDRYRNLAVIALEARAASGAEVL